jgi:tellurite methyltransferase
MGIRESGIMCSRCRQIFRSKTEARLNGGYDRGYAECSCFWGRSAGSLVRSFISEMAPGKALRVLDLGCGEGKNANAFAEEGSCVEAVDCSELAIANGEREFAHGKIRWVQCEAERYLHDCESFDVVIMYGLLHCLPSQARISSVIRHALDKTRKGGHHIIASFNDGPHDLSAHPGFAPTLAPHSFYIFQYKDQHIVSATDSLLHETHPNNGIPHFHSISRLLVRKIQ